MKLTCGERVLRALNREEVDRVPWVELGFHGDVASGILGEEVGCGTGYHPVRDQGEYEKYVRQMIRLCKTIGLDTILLKCWAAPGAFMDTVHKEGASVQKMVGKIQDDAAFERAASQFTEDSQKRLDILMACAETMRRVAGDEDIAIGCPTGGAFSVTWESMGFEGFSLAIYDNPDLIRKLCGVFQDFFRMVYKEVLPILKPDFVWLADDLAFKSGPFMSQEHFREFFLSSFVEAQELTGDLPVILHSDGNFLLFIEDLISAGIKGFHPIEPEAIDIRTLKKNYGDRICIIGNLDLNILQLKGPEEVADAARGLLRDIGPTGYIFSSSNSITQWCPAENVLAMSRVLKGES